VLVSRDSQSKRIRLGSGSCDCPYVSDEAYELVVWIRHNYSVG
jgi:hypothetical protein